MLVIRRRLGEAILIGDEIEIEVLDASASHAKLGIRAPRTIPVVRKEIHVVSTQNRASANEVSAQDLKRLLNALRRKSSSTPSALR
jgi:carbon storage regulator